MFMKEKQIYKSQTFTYPCYVLRISSVYFSHCVNLASSVPRKWSLQWRYREEFKDIYSGITFRNQKFRWFIRMSFVLKTPVSDMSAKKFVCRYQSRCRYCIQTNNLCMGFVCFGFDIQNNENILFSYFRPILSEKNELLIQFLSDLSLTADGFIGHYKFRPKKLPTTTVPPTTTTVPPTSSKLYWLYFIS